MDLTLKDLAVIYNALIAHRRNLKANSLLGENEDIICNVDKVLDKFEETKKDQSGRQSH